MAPCSAAAPGLAPGALIEAEWIPDRWHRGQIREVSPGGRLTIVYDDGYLQSGVAAERVRTPGAAGDPRARGSPRRGDAGSPWAAGAEGSCAGYVHSGGTTSSTTSTTASSSGTSSRSAAVAAAAGSQYRRPELPVLLNAATAEHLRDMRAAAKGEAAAVAGGGAAAPGGACRRRAGDAQLAAEASDFRRGVDSMVEDAVQSNDWWRLQAAMQMVVGYGLEDKWAVRLQEAMRAHSRHRGRAREHPGAAAEGGCCPGGTLVAHPSAPSEASVESRTSDGGSSWSLLSCCGNVQVQQDRHALDRELSLADDLTPVPAGSEGHHGSGAAAQSEASRLLTAMDIYKQRQRASRELRRAVEARDMPRLRRAIGGAQKVRARGLDIRWAQDVLWAVEAVA
mmetsp:Transcript_85284/g.241829  ORF Transcript_85284/g.241829 Transcript_85284/m.241829 type:complete len:395 (-) Transcript_85284:69-1253(-)